MKNQFSLMIHGGCGELTDEQAMKLLAHLPKILQHGKRMLSSGDSSIQVVERCVALLENDPLFNAGRGSVLNEKGIVDLDAGIMDGKDLSAGAVAGIQNIKNPIKLAYAVMKQNDYVMLIGDGAAEFAKAEGIKFVPQKYFLTKERIQQWKTAKMKN